MHVHYFVYVMHAEDIHWFRLWFGVARQQAIISARVVLDRYGHMSGNGIFVICRLLYLRICPNFDNLPEINYTPLQVCFNRS